MLQVSGNMMDMNVVMACQLLLEQVFNEGNSSLLQQLYQHLLFNFRIWTQSHFAVCLGKAKASPRCTFVRFWCLPVLVLRESANRKKKAAIVFKCKLLQEPKVNNSRKLLHVFNVALLNNFTFQVCYFNKYFIFF